MPRTALLGVTTGIFIVLATLVAVALLNFPKSADAAVEGGPLPGCASPSDAVADQGYGVSRTALRRDCAEPSDHSPASTAAR